MKRDEMMGVLSDNPRADALAGELAALTGESVGEAVVKALEERIEREKEQLRLINDLKSIAHDYHRFAGPGNSSDHRWLYDEYGLPR